MDFRLFRSFVAVADELHVGRTAQKLGITQPALSQQIRQLELLLGVSLFNRVNRHFALTRAGTLFLEQARAALDQADRAVDVARRAEKGEVGQMALGFVDSAILGLNLRELLRDFRTAHPDIELTLLPGTVEEQIVSIREGRLDAGVIRAPLPAICDGLSCDFLEREELMACLPACHPLAGRTRVAAAQLKRETFVVPMDPADVGLAGQTALIAAEAGFRPRIARHAGQATTLACLVAAGFGVAILPTSLARLKLEQLVYRPLEKPAYADLYLLSRAHEREPAPSAFVRRCREFAAMEQSMRIHEPPRMVA